MARRFKFVMQVPSTKFQSRPPISNETRTQVRMTNANYFVAVDGKTSGPFKGQQIRNKLNQGKLLESDFIWREGMTEWLPRMSCHLRRSKFRLKAFMSRRPRKAKRTLLMKFGYKNPETLRRL